MALVAPTEEEYELILTRIKNLMEDGRGETIFEVGQPKNMVAPDTELAGYPAIFLPNSGIRLNS